VQRPFAPQDRAKWKRFRLRRFRTWPDRRHLDLLSPSRKDELLERLADEPCAQSQAQGHAEADGCTSSATGEPGQRKDTAPPNVA
jgi:hypothetical protein